MCPRHELCCTELGGVRLGVGVGKEQARMLNEASWIDRGSR